MSFWFRMTTANESYGEKSPTDCLPVIKFSLDIIEQLENWSLSLFAIREIP